MADKEILRVEVDDSEFSEFKKKFDEYEIAVKAMPEQWQGAGSEITAQKTNFEKMLKSADDQNRSVAGALISQEKFNGLIDAASLTWSSLSKSGKLFAGNIVHATQHLTHWKKLTAVFAGIIGAGGLFGINRMVANVAGQRTSAAGLGVSYGEQASFLTNFGRLGNVEGILQGFSEAETDVSKKYALRQYLGHIESGDPAKDFAEGLSRFKDFVDKTSPELLGNMLHAKGYDKLGIGTEQARIVRGMSHEEVAQIGKSYSGDLAERLGLSDADAKKWTEFSTQMGKAHQEIETVFAKNAVKLNKPLGHLSDSFIHLTKALLKDGGPIAGWIKKLGKGIKTFADDLGSGKTQAKATEVGKNIADSIKLFDAIIAKAPNGLAVLLGTGAAAWYGGGVAVAIAAALARSRTLSVLAEGAGVVLGPAGALAAGGLAASSSSTNEEIPERERQRRFHQGPYAPEHAKRRRIFGHPHGTMRPGSAANEAALEGTPWNHEFQSHHDKQGIVSSHVLYDAFIARGATPVAAAALTGNAAYESGSGEWSSVVLDPATDAWKKNWGTGDAAVGAFQWEGLRKHNVDPSPGSQAQHVIDELHSGGETTGGLTLKQLNAIRDPREAAARVNRQYERPRFPKASESTRQDYAARIFHSYGIGHHPATISSAKKTLTIEDNTGGLVTVGAH